MTFHPSRNALAIHGPVSGQNWSFTGWDLSCLASMLRAFSSPNVGEAAREAHLENLWQYWTWLLLCFQFISTRRLLYLVCIVGVQWRIFFYVLFDWDLLQFFSRPFLTDLNAWFSLRILHATNSSSCERHIITVFWTNLEFFLNLARTRCSMSVPPVPKRSSTKRFMIPATNLSVAGLPLMWSNIFSNAASPSDRARDLSEMSIVLFTCVEHLWFQVGLHVWVEYNT